MIYSFILKTESGEKQFFLTADNINQLYRRISSTYGVSKDNVELLEEYKETPNYGYKLVKSHLKGDVDREALTKATSLYREAKRKDEPCKTEYFNKHKYSKIISISDYKDIAPLISKYSKIKVYWELGEKRGQHNYYVMVK